MRPNIKILKMFVISMIAIVLLTCGEAEVRNYTEEVIDGVKYIHNLKPTYETPRIGLEFVRTFGDLESEDENIQLYRPNDVGLDSKGNVYILDTGNFKIKKFSSEGKFIKSFGNKGQGPGEFQYPGLIKIDAQDNIYIMDSRKNELMIFDADLKYTGLIKNETTVQPFHIYNEDMILGNSNSFMISGKTEIKPLFFTFDGEGNVIKEHGQTKKYADNIMNRIGNGIMVDVDKDDNVFVLFSARNRLEKYDKDMNLVLVVDRVLPYEESKKSIVNDGTASGNPFSIYYNEFSMSLEIDHKGRLWSLVCVSQRSAADENKTAKELSVPRYQSEIFDSNGVLLQQSSFNELLPDSKYRIYGDRLFVIDTYKEMVIKEYKIVETQ